MASSFNRVILVGNLCRDPELKYLPSGTAVADVSLAVNDRVKKGDQWVDVPTYIDCTLFGRTAEVANEYLSKGSSALIEGRLKLEQWTNKEGEKRSKLKVVGERLQLLGSKDRTNDESYQPAAKPDVPEIQHDSDEIAF